MIRYGLCDPLVSELVKVARRIFNNHLIGTQGCCASCGRSGAVTDYGQSHAAPRTPLASP